MKPTMVALLALLILNISSFACAKETVKPSAWPMRYVLFVDTESWYQAGVENWRENPREKVRLQGFIPATFAKAQGAKERLAAMRVNFDINGNVLTKTLNGVPLRGVFDSDFLHLVTPTNYIPAWRISSYMDWLPYEYDASNGDQPWEENRMLLCTTDEGRRLQIETFNEIDNPSAEYKLEPEEGLFFCNDWSKQLANPDRPWIDVTSYEKRGPRVRKFQGYGLFGVIKPVVGKHYKTWICFADCPDGKPGPIADIKAWSKKYELPVENRNYGT